MNADRERELLTANNAYLERARTAERRLKQVEEERDRAVRRCDMYHGQCDRQAAELGSLRMKLAPAATDYVRPEAYDLFRQWETAGVDMGYSFKHLERKTGLPRNLIRGDVLALSRLGWLEFKRGCFTEDGEPYGCAYVLTEAGFTALHSPAPPPVNDAELIDGLDPAYGGRP